MTQLLLPVKEAARQLGISVWTLRKKAYRGEIASVKIGVKLLISEREIERLIRNGMRPRRHVHRRTARIAGIQERLGVKTSERNNKRKTEEQ